MRSSIHLRPVAVARWLLVAGLLAATAPVWRWFAAGAAPSIDELLQLRCSGAAVSRVGRPPAARPAAATSERRDASPSGAVRLQAGS